MNPLITERLLINQLNNSDAAFIQELLNTEEWIKYIGDRNVHNKQAAISYLEHGPLKSYEENSFGLMAVRDPNSLVPMGMCGLLKRAYLDSVDLGFAFLPEFTKKGYAFESAESMLKDARERLQLEKIYAITSIDNVQSIKLLNKLGFKHIDIITEPHTHELLQLFEVH